ncbi:MAG TPA: hypothetical protein PLV62_07310, partial [Spirochaetota bacterium]|nr:hypothetical protein [Spirochaetota bacterium]
MKNNVLYGMLTILLVFIIAGNGYAQRKRGDYFLKPQIGIWFGPVTPVFSTADDVDTDLWGGGFMRFHISSL